MISPWIEVFPDTDPLSLLHLAGDPDQQNKLRLLCNEFRDIFSNELPVEPADISPFDLNVDDSKWKVSRNRTPPRPQSDIARQTAVLEKQGIIEKSNVAYYSQVLMIPKPDGSKRMCIDFRNLNDCTEDASWPILFWPAQIYIESARPPTSINRSLSKIKVAYPFEQLPRTGLHSL
jgi:hypothetical protein